MKAACRQGSTGKEIVKLVVGTGVRCYEGGVLGRWQEEGVVQTSQREDREEVEVKQRANLKNLDLEMSHPDWPVPGSLPGGPMWGAAL